MKLEGRMQIHFSHSSELGKVNIYFQKQTDFFLGGVVVWIE